MTMIHPSMDIVRSRVPTRDFFKKKFLVGEIPSSMTKEKRRVAKEGVLGQLEKVARDKSNSDPVLMEVLLMHLHYNWGKGRNPRTPWIDEPRVVNGVKFWRVGHNALHEFYAGTDGNGRKFSRSVGESCTIDIDGMPLEEDSIPGIDENVSEVADFNGYHGHF